MGLLKAATRPKLSATKAALPQWATTPVVVSRGVEPKPPPVAPDAPQPLPWRRRLAGWPEEWRERWGRLANALEDQGLGWRDAEERAWVETLKVKRDAERTGEAVVAAKVQGTFKESA